MNDKIKWFGRYLGCEITFSNEHGRVMTLTGIDYHMDTLYSNRWMDEEFSPFNALLILKELKDISDEDLDIINGDWGKYGAAHTKDDIINRISLIDYTDIDTIRGLGYAIGIPKEYYITESELKEAE